MLRLNPRATDLYRTLVATAHPSTYVRTMVEEFLLLVGSIHNLTLAYSSEENAIVERCSKEVNRHIKAYTYDIATTENY